jgi:uncharacterized protein (DUF58 family)
MRLRPLNLPWRAPRIESGPIRLRAGRLFIVPTRAGLVFAVLLLGLLVGAINYGVSLAYLFTFWFAGLAIVGMLHTQRNLAGLVLIARAPAPVFAGEEAVFRLRAEHDGGRARGRVALRHGELESPPVDVPAGGADLVLALPQARRGWHAPGRFSVRSEWPLGLFRCWAVLAPDWGVLVYPAPAADARPLPTHDVGDDDAEATRRSTRGEGSEFTGLRAYQPGDPPRRIAWKAVARGGQGLLTKDFAGTGGARRLWLDWGQTAERDVEARLSRLTRWVLDAHAAGLAYGLRLPGRTLPPQTGETHLRQCLEALALHGSSRP